MKQYTFIISIVFVSFLLLASSTLLFAASFRTLKITVIDPATKAPVNNALVYYFLQGAQRSHFLGIPLLDPINFRNLRVGTYRTDENGLAVIRSGYISLKLYEKIFNEEIYINLDSTQSNLDPISFTRDYIFNTENLYNPIAKYKGLVVYSCLEDAGKKEYIEHKELYDYIYLDGINLKQKDDFSITVELPRYSDM